MMNSLVKQSGNFTGEAVFCGQNSIECRVQLFDPRRELPWDKDVPIQPLEAPVHPCVSCQGKPLSEMKALPM